MSPAARRPSEVFARRLREVRDRLGLSAKDVADRLAESGVGLDRAAISKLEADPPQRGLSLDEALAICAALGVSPRAMIFPDDPNDRVMVGERFVTGLDGRHWLDGESPLGGTDDRAFFSETADEDWRLSRAPDYQTVIHRVRLARDDFLAERPDAGRLLDAMAVHLSAASFANIRRQLEED